MEVGYVQTMPRFGRKEENVREALRLAERVSTADLLVFPELFNTGYLFASKREAREMSERVDGPTVSALREFSRRTETAVVAGFAERGDGGAVYNSAVVIDERGKVVGVYRKTHLFDREKEWFDPGDSGFEVFELAGARVGVMICFDWIFPEACRTLSLKGAHIVAHPANLVLPYAQTAMLARSVENRVFTITANRVGEDVREGVGRISFTGKSQVTSPSMEVLVRGPADRPHAASVEIDPEQAEDKRITERNHLFEDRRREFYEL